MSNNLKSQIMHKISLFGWSSAKNGSFDYDAFSEIRMLIMSLKIEEDVVWIPLSEKEPEHGRKIKGKSHAGEWTDVWDEDEPHGSMTHWRYI